MSRKHIVYLDHTAKWSGGEIALYRSLSAIQSSEFEMTAVLGENGTFKDKLKGIEIEAKVFEIPSAVRNIKKDSISGVSKRDGSAIRSYIKYAIGLSRVLKSINADLIHCNSLKADIYGLVVAKLIKVPVIWHIRDHVDSSYLPARVARVIQNLAVFAPSAVITNSNSTMSRLFPNGKKNRVSSVVYDGLMSSELQADLPDVITEWSSKPRIGMVGRITPWKGQHIFLEAIGNLMGLGVSAEYEIIGSPIFGEDNYFDELKETARKLGGTINFLGFKDDIPAILRDLDILVHCSIIAEPFGQVIIEGMAEGLPVIASNGGGVPEIISSTKYGIMTPMGDATKLAEALKSLILQPEVASQLGRHAHRHVREMFTADRSAGAIESIYRQLF